LADGFNFLEQYKRKGIKMKEMNLKKQITALFTVILILSAVFASGVFAQNQESTDLNTGTTSIGVEYRGHVQNYGDLPQPAGTYLVGPIKLGTSGEGLRLEGIAIRLTGDVPAGAGIQYAVHIQNKGWSDYFTDGVYAGTTGRGLQLEAIKINLVGLDGYDVYYRGHVQNKGNIPDVNGQWGWVKNGEELGTTGECLRLESIEIKIVKTNNDVALGDSIAYGMSATPGSGYANLFYNDLKTQTGNEDMALLNLGVPGETSTQLLTKVQTDETTRAALKNASVITVSIGGNNLLQPLIQIMASAFGLDPTSETFAADLATALADPNAQAIINAKLPELQTSLTAGAQQFATDFPQIIQAIRLQAPTATLYVTTLYDPINESDPLYAVFDPIIQGMNGIIMTPDSGYKVADAYTAFKAYNGVEPLVNFNWYTGNLDPHPTNMGHSVIYQCHLSAQ
jgi:lysophospholipase L1-like esterase